MAFRLLAERCPRDGKGMFTSSSRITLVIYHGDEPEGVKCVSLIWHTWRLRAHRNVRPDGLANILFRPGDTALPAGGRTFCSCEVWVTYNNSIHSQSLLKSNLHSYCDDFCHSCITFLQSKHSMRKTECIVTHNLSNRFFCRQTGLTRIFLRCNSLLINYK